MTGTLLPPAADLRALRARVRALAEQRPAVYRMTDAAGRVLYVGKARRLRARLQSYFRARYPEEKAARILHAAHDVAWDYVPSEFAAHLAELRQIARWRPPFNVRMNRGRHLVFLTVSGGRAPRLGLVSGVSRTDARRYGPIASPGRAREALRVLNDLLGLRDCAERMPIVFADQGDLFAAPRRAACLRHELGACLGPCAGFVAEAAYRQRVDTVLAFLEGRALAPVDRVVDEMMARSDRDDFEGAARWRERFERLEWLFAALNRARSAVELLTFVYRDPGAFGDDRAYLVRRGTVRAVYPWPATPIECEAFRAVVAAELAHPESPAGPLPAGQVEEVLLLLAWFRRHPEALRRTEPLEAWAPRETPVPAAS
jgi:excinuclease ABC subunit C